MSNKDASLVRAKDKEVQLLYGVITFGASGAVSSETSFGFAFTKPSGTGLYRITLEDDWPELLGLFLTVTAGTAADVMWQQKTDLSSRVIDVSHLSAGVAANATSGHKLSVMLVLKNSTVAP